MERYLVFHRNCPDGWGAAWSAYKAWGDEAKYIPALYGDEPPVVPIGATVVVADFSYPRQALVALETRCRLIVLDHHKSAEADLAGLDFCTFDMNKSGAMLAWEYFHPGQKAPLLIQYVQDRDLWRFALVNSREVAAWLRSYPMDFEVWDKLANELERHSKNVFREGEAILRFQNQQVETMCKQAVIRAIGGHAVPVANATVFFSEVGERLCQLYPEAPFAAYYFDRADGQQQWGLRSRNDFDVSEIAKIYGGGGHRAAAGFQREANGAG